MPTEQPSRPDAEHAERVARLHARSLEAARSLLDPQRHLIALPSASDPTLKTYWQAGSLPLAYALLANGDPDMRREAAHIVAAALDSQETTPGHPHRGNWTWLADDPEVGDLNAIQFVLRWLLPLLVDHSHRLPADLQARCRESVRLALEEEERMQVAPTFSNIHIVSLFALLVGGAWLDDEHFLAVGKARWAAWVDFTVNNGAPHEYNSPDYLGWQLSGLALIHRYAPGPAIRLQARLMLERFWLHLALHIHQPTGQMAGPHSRAYWYTMATGRGAAKDALWLETGLDWAKQPGPYGGDDAPPGNFMTLAMALVDYRAPDYLIGWLAHQADKMPYEVRETANRDEGLDLTTYCTPGYALGTASRTYAIGTDCFYIEHEANNLMLHYKRPSEQGGWGMMYSRYVVNERHWGSMGPAPDRPKTGNFYEHGHFAGVQQRNKAIALYALMPEQQEVFSLKTVVAFQSGASLERVWINDQPVDLAESGQSLSADDWLIVEDGGVYVGVRALQPSVLRRDAPIQLERGPLGELWLAIYNYRGAAIRFWEYASLKGAFWRGNLRAGFVVEVAERREHPSAAAFLAHLRGAHIADTVDAACVRTVSYTNGGDSLALRYDLWKTQPAGRVIAGKAYAPPHLTSPLAVQGDAGSLALSGAMLYTQPQPMWLIALADGPGAPSYTAVNPLDRATPLRFETPLGAVTASAWGLGRIGWRVTADGEQEITVDCLRAPKDLIVPDGARVVWRDPLPTHAE
ncbi:MAG: hypothetical protein IT323_12535 [Anaerolineae bacterium]|nr:hypothetical protein [Anaerolineae bacterium]